MMIKGRYELQEMLGQGGMSTVYRAFDHQQSQIVAIKILKTGEAHWEMSQRFRREYRVLKRLDHPNIVRVYDFDHEESTFFMVMELLEGVTLNRYRIQQGGIIQPEVLVSFTQQIIQALIAIHAEGLVHRDLKPGNIMVSGNTIKLMDFGLVKQYDTDLSLTMPGTFMGTMNYISPEQVTGGEVDYRSDFYALGVILYEALSGDLPFYASDPISMMMKHVSELPLPIQKRCPAIPEDWGAFVMRLLAKNPAERPSSGEELLKFLERIAGHSFVPLKSPKALHADMIFSAPFVGRNDELMVLNTLLHSPGTGTIFVAISGETGIGKTRFMKEFTKSLTCDDVAYVYLDFHENEQLAYHPLNSLIEQLQRLVSGGSSTVKPGITPQDEPDTIASIDTQLTRKKHESYSKVINNIRLLSESNRFVLLLDNAQWIDSDMADLLMQLFRQSEPLKLLIVNGFRAEELNAGHLCFHLQKKAEEWAELHRITLNRLSRQTTEELLGRILGEKQVDSEILTFIHKETDGNPFFIMELLKIWIEEGKLVRRYGIWNMDTYRDTSIPSSIQELLLRRVSRLNGMAQKFLEVFSIIGEETTFEFIAAISRVNEEELLDALEETIRAGIIKEERTKTGERYLFSHHMIRKVIYNNASLTRRRLTHKRIAQALLTLQMNESEKIILLAEHFYAAQDWDTALSYLFKAASLCSKQGLVNQAMLYSTRGIDCVSQSTTLAKSKKITCLIEHLLYLNAAGADTEALEVISETFELIKLEREYDLLHRFLHSGANVFLRNQAWDMMESILSEIESLPIREFPKRLSGFVCVLRGYRLRYGEDFENATSNFKQCIDYLIDEPQDIALIALAFREIANIQLLSNKFSEARSYYERMVQFKQEHQLELDMFDCLDYGIALNLMNEPDKALEWLDKAERANRYHGYTNMSFELDLQRSYILFIIGKWSQSFKGYKKIQKTLLKSYGYRHFISFITDYLELLRVHGQCTSAHLMVKDLLNEPSITYQYKRLFNIIDMLLLLEQFKTEEAEYILQSFQKNKTEVRVDERGVQLMEALLMLARHKIPEALQRFDLFYQSYKSDYESCEYEFAIALWGKCVCYAHSKLFSEALQTMGRLKTEGTYRITGWKWMTALELAQLLDRAEQKEEAQALSEYAFDLIHSFTDDEVLDYWMSRRSFHILSIDFKTAQTFISTNPFTLIDESDPNSE